MGNPLPPPRSPNLLELLEIRDCGLRARDRDARVVALWKVCFDESFDGEQKEACVVAGVIGDERHWKKLYDAWARALRRGKSIPHYSTKDGGRRKDPESVFYGWTDDQVLAKRRLLAEAIADNADAILWSAVEIQLFNAVLCVGDKLPDPWHDAFIPAFCTSLGITALYMNDRGRKFLSIKKPLMVFDELSSPKLRKRVQLVYDAYRLADPVRHPTVHGVGRWLRPSPDFAEDKAEEPGLQIADLISGAIRRSRNSGEGEILTILDRAGSKGVSITAEQIRQWKGNTLELLAHAKKKRTDGHRR